MVYSYCDVSEIQYEVMWVPLSWKVRTKVSCDALRSVVDASKTTLEESFDARADIYVTKMPRRLCHRQVSHNQIVIIVLKSKGYGII